MAPTAEFAFYLADGSVQLRKVSRECVEFEWPLIITEAVHTPVECGLQGSSSCSHGNYKTRAFALKSFSVLEPPFYGRKIRFYVEV